MEIDLVPIVAFIITVLLFPAYIYIWKLNQRRIAELEKENKEQEVAINELQVDIEKTKTNYTEKFSELNSNINDKFTATNKTISDLAIEVGKAIGHLKASR